MVDPGEYFAMPPRNHSGGYLQAQANKNKPYKTVEGPNGEGNEAAIIDNCIKEVDLDSNTCEANL